VNPRAPDAPFDPSEPTEKKRVPGVFSPLLDENGSEPAWQFRLNSLMNRAVDQDLIISALTLFHETRKRQATGDQVEEKDIARARFLASLGFAEFIFSTVKDAWSDDAQAQFMALSDELATMRQR
jgi:hypothetical protein